VFNQVSGAATSARDAILDLIFHRKKHSLAFTFSTIIPMSIFWASSLQFFVYKDMSAMYAGAGMASAFALLFCISMASRQRLQRWFADVYISGHPVGNQQVGAIRPRIACGARI